MTDVSRLQGMFPHSPLRTGRAPFKASGSPGIGDFLIFISHRVFFHQGNWGNQCHSDFTT
jgi:hypothetical protein